MSSDEKFNGLTQECFNEHQALIDRGYGERFIALMAKNGYDTGRTLEMSLDHFGKYLRINHNMPNTRINLLLTVNTDIKYVVMSPAEGMGVYAFNSSHADIVNTMKTDADSCAKKGLPTAWYNKKWNYEDGYKHTKGGFMELAFDEAGKPYISVFGRSFDYGGANHEKTVELLQSIGINAKVDATRAKYMRS